MQRNLWTILPFLIGILYHGLLTEAGSFATKPLLHKRGTDDGRGGCNGKGYSAKARRSVFPSTNALSKRAPFSNVPNTGDNNGWDTFMVAQMGTAQSVIVENGNADIVPNNAWFRQLGDTEVNLGVESFSGCITLVVMSEQAVYYTHFFEDTSFPTQDSGTPQQPVDDFGGFQGNVVDLLDNGRSDYTAPNLPTQIQESLKSHQSSFQNQPGLNAVLFVGKITDTDLWPDGQPMYQDSINTILPQVEGYIGVSPQVVEYVMQSNDVDPPPKFNVKNKDTTALGKAIFQYNPNSGNGPTHKAYRLLLERNQQVYHEW
ncbi:MAG: hypothetical protein Q9165_005790 [Trypethelium subeluteriae]